jgi:LmbE family N-acetylglucosaminyl deacetylase
MQSTNKCVFAIGAHPDDIEFMMAGTLFLLKEAGFEVHYMNLCNGCCGSAEYDVETAARVRREEAREAAEFLGAVFHDSLVPDLEAYYERETLARLTSVMREVAPDILLTQYPFDYMEDHSNTVRLAVSAAFCRGMQNAVVIPPREAVDKPVAVYHAMPYGLRDPLRRTPQADLFVDISSVLGQKKEMLAKHRSQKEWLDASQGMDSYLTEMEDQARACGKLSGEFDVAEGWIRRLHLGYCGPDDNPLAEALSFRPNLIHSSTT